MSPVHATHGLIRGLAIEAATGQLSLAAGDGSRTELLDLRPAREHTPRIYEYADQLLAAVGTGYAGLDFAAFGCGPGSFTGVRIAAAAVQAIAFARDLPVCRVSSLAVLAQSAGRLLGPGLYGICQDARMGRVYAALYDTRTGLHPLQVDILVDPAEFVLPGQDAFVALGDGWTSCPGMTGRHRGRIRSMEPDIFPCARDLLAMAEADFRAGRTLAAHEALPEYLGQMPARPGDAKESS